MILKTMSDTTDAPESDTRARAFFGRVKGKRLRPSQMERRDTLLPALRLDTDAPVKASSTGHPLGHLFAHDPSEVWLEIGFGGAEHLLHQAQAHPDIGLIGVEPFVNGMAKALAGIEADQIGNIRLYDDDANFLLDVLPDGALDRLYLLYPDPWPKKRHWKRRFINEARLGKFARVLKPGGLFLFASDIDTYVDWTLDHVARHNRTCSEGQSLHWRARKPADWTTPFPDWVRTRYEAKAYREGRTPAYLTFRKGSDA